MPWKECHIVDERLRRVCRLVRKPMGHVFFKTLFADGVGCPVARPLALFVSSPRTLASWIQSRTVSDLMRRLAISLMGCCPPREFGSVYSATSPA